MTVYRIFLRSGRQVLAQGAAERDRLMSRKTPAAYHHEVAEQHCCDQCGKRDYWGETWIKERDFSPKAHRRGAIRDDHKGQATYCSRACWVEATGGPDLAPWVWKTITEEPVSLEKQRARGSAKWDDERAVSKKRTEHRKVPMAEWPGDKHCRWCGGAIPKSSRRRSWHEECLRTYLLHSDPAVQYRFLARSDGEVCSVEGCGETRGLQVEHTIPLWKVRDLPDDERLHFYGPENLTLMCPGCHKEKTAREAAERAQKP